MTPPNMFVVEELLSADLVALIHRRGTAPKLTLDRALAIALDIINGLVSLGSVPLCHMMSSPRDKAAADPTCLLDIRPWLS